MTVNPKQLSNSFSTGSGGARFESNIQATFVTLMLTGGYAPCLPTWPIVEIKLQGMVAGYATDDLVVFIKNPISNERRRLLGQVKHSIAVTEANPVFRDVIQAAWRDFNNSDLFTKGHDVIALITGPISATDTDGVNGLLDQARHTGNVDEFLTQVGRARFCSDNVRKKLEAFKAHLKLANNDEDVADVDLYEFLKHFHLLGYDVARKGSVVSSLLQSHIAQFNKDIPDKIWYQILYEVQEANQNAGTVNLNTLPEDLIAHFREPQVTHIPKELADGEEERTGSELPVETNWNLHSSAQKMAVATLIGSWDESRASDLEIVSRIVGEDYSSWVTDLRETLQIHDSPLTYKNSVWNFKDRSLAWQELGGRIFDDHLDSFKEVALEVLCVDDPSFDLPSHERYAAALHGKVLSHSVSLREGLAETLALTGSQAASLTNCSSGKADEVALLTIRELFDGSEWIRWGSLNNLLPTLSEACPGEFLRVVENSIATIPSPFDRLFEEEGSGGFGISYITGLLWALEGIAWHDSYLSRASIVLSEIASHDPGGSWANRPDNSLTDIFLPWHPHTLASVHRREVVLQAICREQPGVAWKLLQRLLPNQTRSTSGTHRPIWREVIPEGWEPVVTRHEFVEHSRFCAELLVEQAGYDIGKLTSLVGNYDHLPVSASETFLDKLRSEHCVNLPEDERVPLWSALCKLIAHHRRFPESHWSLGEESLTLLEDIAAQLAPKNIGLLHKRLFSEASGYLYEGDGGQEDQDRLFEIRKSAVGDILTEGGLSQVLEFVSTVSNANLVGEILADFDQREIDAELFPNYLKMSDHKLWPFVAAYAWRRRYMGGWKWFDDIEKSDWSPQQIAALLCALPFEQCAWDRAAQLLVEKESEYWENIPAKPYCSDSDVEYALAKLLEVGRPNVVIDGLAGELFRKKKINPNLACDALLALVKSEESTRITNSYYITQIIQSLQKDAATDQDRLRSIEWAYLTLLDQHSDVSPITLENELASDPSFFCKLIQMIFRPRGAEQEAESSEQKRNLANNAYRLLSVWKVVPGTNKGVDFDPDAFLAWLDAVEEFTTGSGHYDVAMVQLGHVLVNAPKGANGLWIEPVIADALNSRERSSLRDGYRTGTYNSRGVHTVDPEAKPERALAAKYRERADDIDNEGYQRLATTLRELASSYDHEAEKILSRSTPFA